MKKAFFRIALGFMALGFLSGTMAIAFAQNAGSTRQSCKKGFYWDYKLAKCNPNSQKPKRNRIKFTE